MAGQNISLGTKLRKTPTNRGLRDKINYTPINSDMKYMPSQEFIFDINNLNVISSVYYGIERLMDKYYKNKN